MNKKKIAIFTKTNWDEPPRIRHQLTRLLSSYGHEVVFFEKSSFWQFSTVKKEAEGISFIRHFELIHHQLRPFGFLVKLNQMVAKYFIRKNINEDEIDFIINFNYDYSFLKQMFPSKKVVTLINDDFIATAKPWMGLSAQLQLKATCEQSDTIFAVSYPLCDALRKFNEHTKLFLPWAGKKYAVPSKQGEARDVVLYWGYIDHRIDWSVIGYLLENNVKLRFVGSVHSNAQEKIESYKAYDNFEMLAPSSIDEVFLDDVVCSVLAYDTTRLAIKAVTVSNRAFQLLSYGIPLLYSDLPYLIESPREVMTRCKVEKDYLNGIEYFSRHFDSCQGKIEEFLNEHYAGKRYHCFLKEFK